MPLVNRAVLRVLVHAPGSARVARLKDLDHAPTIRNREQMQTKRVLLAAEWGRARSASHKRRRGRLVQEGVNLFATERLRKSERRRIKRRIQVLRDDLHQSFERS